MTLSRPQQAFFSLLQAGLWEESPRDLSALRLSAEEWEEVFSLSVRQTVSGLTYIGLQFLPDELLPSDVLLARWVARVNRIEDENRRMSAALRSLLAVFRSHGISPVLQKGHAVARFYTHPAMRVCGDIDLYFPEGEMEAATGIVKALGCKVDHRPDGSVTYLWEGIEIEHHTILLDLRNPFRLKAVRSLISRHGFTPMTIDGDIDISVPSPLLELLMINVHIMKHSFGVGIGLRQICDYARACHSLHSLIDRSELLDAYRRLGIEKWSEMLDTFVSTYLAAPREILPTVSGPASQPSVSTLLDIVLSGGNFGHYHPMRNRFVNKSWQRKFHTLSTFFRHCRFSSALAPAEAFWTAMGLLSGNVR